MKWGFGLGWGCFGIAGMFGTTREQEYQRGLRCLWSCRQKGSAGGRERMSKSHGKAKSEGPSFWGLGREGSWPKKP